MPCATTIAALVIFSALGLKAWSSLREDRTGKVDPLAYSLALTIWAVVLALATDVTTSNAWSLILSLVVTALGVSAWRLARQLDIPGADRDYSYSSTRMVPSNTDDV